MAGGGKLLDDGAPNEPRAAEDDDSQSPLPSVAVQAGFTPAVAYAPVSRAARCALALLNKSHP
jgi:hypothetical protein